MNEYYYTYSKLRQEFGRHCNFEVSEPKLLGAIDPKPELRNQYVRKNPRTFVSDNIMEMSEHMVNTERVSVGSKGMKHVEGGWPKEVDPSEIQETAKWRKRLDRDPGFATAIKQLSSEATRPLMQNDTLDIFEDYFAGETVQTTSGNLSARSLMLFKDKVTDCKRTATCIAWHPEGSSKLAVAYAILKFQKQPDPMPSQAYIWDVTQSNTPLTELTGQGPVVSIMFNNKITDVIVGGCYNGLISLWDLRKGTKPADTSRTENSHYDPVYDVMWLQSKTNNELVSVSTDGHVLWWDTRNLSAPVEDFELPDVAGSSQTVGGMCVEWSVDAGPTKYLVGTERGSTVTLKKKPKKGDSKTVEIAQRFGQDTGRHYGPVYAVRRNPFHPKYFLTVGDWTAKIWMEEIKSPIICTDHHPASLLNCQWSPTRPGLFMVCREDGFLDFWDYYYRQNEVTFQHKVSDAALWSIAVQSQGQHVAVGDSDGAVTLLELCDDLHIAGSNEKVAVGHIFERETRREKNIEQSRRQAEARRSEEKSAASKAAEPAKGKLSAPETLQKLREEFFASVGIDPSVARPRQETGKASGHSFAPASRAHEERGG
uniref:Dynein intermediate chain, putative n=1 Tax=Neospora caninum (strain Liverpool) TaxID=572307 RepID=A0A0F7U5C9_NEOCL|nr:TPA: dynein intermediate chain, putative [Neospora caninum Liverpool]